MLSTRSPLLDERFLPLEALGRGGAGRVLRAFDRSRQRLVALKVVDLPGRAGPSHPLAGEFEAWARLRHPNVVRAHELRQVRSGPLPAGTPYLVLEHVEGAPAHRALPPGATTEATLRSLARQVLAGLAHVHASGLVHRDVKPGNVLVRCGRGRLRAKLTDFGLAIASGSADLPGCVSGSLPYVAPEALLGRPVDGRADLYGLGLLLYVLAAGTLPMGMDAEPEEVLAWHLHGPEPDLRARRPDLSSAFARFVARLAARDRERRPPDSAAALRCLGNAIPRPRGARVFGRAELAAVRLALDAARLGARRVLRVPRDLRATEDAAVRAQVLGLSVIRLGPDLAAAVLDLLLERGPEVAEVLRKHGLSALPLSVFGGLPVWDRLKRPGAATSDEVRQATAGGIAALIRDAARRAPRLLLVPAGAREEDPLLAATVDRVVGDVERTPGAPGAPGGLLVLLEVGSRPRRRTGTVPVTLARSLLVSPP